MEDKVHATDDVDSGRNGKHPRPGVANAEGSEARERTKKEVKASKERNETKCVRGDSLAIAQIKNM
jgi:hypothetical protein